MQILGLSESTPKPENRLKTLFWPRIRYEEDVEYIGTQGFWVCVVIAVMTAVLSFGRLGAAGLVDAFYFYLAGVGIRRRSRFAAISVLLVYLTNVYAAFRIHHSGGILSILFLALLFSNVRATWLAAYWARHAPEPPPLPLNETLMDKFSERLPRLIWPIGQWLYYLLTALEFLGLASILIRGAARA